jgi:hypothetical protein
MNRDDIIRLAIECQLVTTGSPDGIYMDALERFAILVAAAERRKQQEYFIKELETESNRWPLSEEVKTACKCLIDTVNRGLDDD